MPLETFPHLLDWVEDALDELPFEPSDGEPLQSTLLKPMEGGLAFIAWGSGVTAGMAIWQHPGSIENTPSSMLFNLDESSKGRLLKLLRRDLENPRESQNPPAEARTILMEMEMLLAGIARQVQQEKEVMSLSAPLPGKFVIAFSVDPELGRTIFSFSRSRSDEAALQAACERMRTLSILKEYEQKPVPPSGPQIVLPIKIFRRFMETEAESWRMAGTELYSPDLRAPIRMENLRIGFRAFSRDEWLKIDFYLEHVHHGGKAEAHIKRWDQTRGLVQDSKGNWHLLNRLNQKRLTSLSTWQNVEEESGFQIPGSAMLQALVMEQLELSEEEARHWPRFPQNVREPVLLTDLNLPAGFKTQLKPFQETGVQFVLDRFSCSLGACIADEMGLGKTVQALAVMHALKARGEASKILLLVPATAKKQWMGEITRFAPHLKPAIRLNSWQKMRTSQEELQKTRWDLIVADEFQVAKNASTQTFKALASLSSRNRLALSGTPIENNLGELWSLLEFLCPGILGSRRWFDKHLAQAIEKEDLKRREVLLKSLTSRLVLRRTSQDLSLILPRIQEQTIRIAPLEEEASAYMATTRWFQKLISEKENKIKRSGRHTALTLTALLRLRQIVVDPVMADEELFGVESAKHRRLVTDLRKFATENQKVLVFSQFRQYLEKLSHMVPGQCITGTMTQKRRQESMEWFRQGEDSRILYITLKAGGVALNLPEASSAILIEPWWNPHAEAQAIGRARRLGREKPLPVYRYVTMATVEERMNELREKKMNLLDGLGDPKRMDEEIPSDWLYEILGF